MAITYPKNCYGITAGALQQIKSTGSTENCGGYFSVDIVKNMIANTIDYFSKIEPCGVFMSDLEKKEKEINSISSAIQKASHLMVESAKEANSKMSDISGKTRDGAEKLGVAIDKFMKIASRPDFEQKVKTMEQFVSAMERLSIIEDSGKLDKIMRSFNGG